LELLETPALGSFVTFEKISPVFSLNDRRDPAGCYRIVEMLNPHENIETLKPPL